MLPISKPVLLEELGLASRILAKWEERLEAGIPHVEMPADESAYDDFMQELCGELMLISTKCESIASLLAQEAE